MLDIKEYLKQTKTVLVTQDAFDELVKKASAQQERTKGKGRWMRKNDGVYCSACYKGWDFMTGVPAEVETEYKFCPNCGADMRGEQDGKNP